MHVPFLLLGRKRHSPTPHQIRYNIKYVSGKKLFYAGNCRRKSIFAPKPHRAILRNLLLETQEKFYQIPQTKSTQSREVYVPFCPPTPKKAGTHPSKVIPGSIRDRLHERGTKKAHVTVPVSEHVRIKPAVAGRRRLVTDYGTLGTG